MYALKYLGLGPSLRLQFGELGLQLLVLSLQHQLAALQLLCGGLLRA